MVKQAGSRWGRGPLRPHELAEAAVLADVAVALIVVGWLLPATTLFILVATLPMAAIAARHRLRAAVAGGVAGTVLGMLIAGTGLAGNVASVAVVGALLGVAWRRRWGWLRLVAVAVGGLWPFASLVADGSLLVFSRLRQLALAQITNTWSGAKANLTDLGLGAVTHPVDPVVKWVVGHWALGVPGALLAGILAGAILGRILAWGPLDRIERARPSRAQPPDQAAHPAEPPTQATAMPPAPVPVELVEVSFTYPGMTTPALDGVSLTVGPGQFVAVVGPNGSGKSTLARILAGRPPTSGSVLRAGVAGGSAALGHFGGTAMIFQRPETQVLGVRVCDDVVWGLPRHHAVDIDHLLRRVGLGGFAARETSTLSGGELQRLAVASALARSPRLLVSDESTAMVDAEGRELLADLLATLAADAGLAVVHVTHRPADARRADRTLYLAAGRLVDAPPATPEVSPILAGPTAAGAAGHGLQLSGVGHVYTPRSPWAHRALAGIDLEVAPGEAVMVLGRNGSGKSTLAWAMAGLLVPSEGVVRLDGRPLARRLGQVALSFQHARLQLLRRTVARDIRAASGVDAAGADAALELVGLDPADLAARSVDQLSGGQQRRVALAGMLARQPRVLVLDEPFAGLDDAARRALISVLARLRAETGLTLIVVTHDTEGADQMVDRVVTLDHGRITDDRPLRELAR